MERQKVLLVDDTASLLKLGKAIFESGGYDVITANDGLDALEQLKCYQISLIITDILMPNMDGYLLCYQIRHNEQFKHIPIIIYSATYTSQTDEKLALDIGADMFIRKPATMSFLLNAAEGLIAASGKAIHNVVYEPELKDVMKQYNTRLIEKLEEKNHKLSKAQADLLKSERRFRALIENNFDAIFLRNENGELIYQSPSAQRITGYTLEEMKQISPTGLYHPEDVALVAEMIKRSLAEAGRPIFFKLRLLSKSQQYLWIEGSFTNLLADEYVNALVVNFRDISERKLAEDKLLISNRLYAFVSHINQTIVHAKNESDLFKRACRVAVEVGKFKIAWLGLFDTVAKKISWVEGEGLATEDMHLFANADYQKNGTQGYVLNEGRSYVCNDLSSDSEIASWKQLAFIYNLKSYMVVPVRKSGVIIGTFNLFSSDLNLFDEQEIYLIEEIVGDISFALDVFEKEKLRREMEENVKHSELRLKQAQSVAHVGSWEVGFTSGFIYWSEETCRIYGLSPEENIQTQESWMSFVHPDDLDYVLKVTEKGVETLGSYSFYHRIIRRSGEIRHIYAQVQFDLDHNGIAIGMFGAAHDITDTIKAEESIKRSEANLRLIIDIIPHAIFSKNGNGDFLFVNKNFAELYGLTPEDIVAKNITETVPGKNQAQLFIDQDREIIASGLEKIIPEQPFTDYRGRERLFYSVKVPFTLAGSNEKAVLGISIDITEQKEAENERTKMITDMLQRNKDLEQFSQIVSHNLRAPVANILGLIDIIQAIGLEAGESDGIVSFLATAAKSLDVVIKDINQTLALRQEVGKLNEYVRFDTLLNEIKQTFSNIIEEQRVLIISDFSEMESIISLKSYLYSIFLNLISNSIKYRRAEIVPIIEVTSSKLNNGVLLIFRDNGLGIDLKARGKDVFGLYKRFHFHVEGKGMGLFMVKTQVIALGGNISLKSEENKGTEFRIELYNK